MGPARAFSLARTCPPKPWRRREARRQFRSKKVRISSNKRTKKTRAPLVPMPLSKFGDRDPDFPARRTSGLSQVDLPPPDCFAFEAGGRFALRF